MNSVAGGGRARDYLQRIQSLFESRHIQAQFVMTNSAAELESSAQNAILRGRRTFFAMGGDGTFQALANAAFGADVVLRVLRLGGGNDLAAALGLPDDPVKAAEAILRGGPRFVDLLRVRTAEGRARLYAGGGGIGLDAEAARYASGVNAVSRVERATLRRRFERWPVSRPWKSTSSFRGAISSPTKGMHCL